MGEREPASVFVRPQMGDESRRGYSSEEKPGKLKPHLHNHRHQPEGEESNIDSITKPMMVIRIEECRTYPSSIQSVRPIVICSRALL